MTRRYREHQLPNYPRSESFGIDDVKRLLSVAGASALRIYYGLNENGEFCSILVAADASGNNILPAQADKLAGKPGDPVILDDGIRCPPICPKGGSLLDEG